jgi:hypothetical protein
MELTENASAAEWLPVDDDTTTALDRLRAACRRLERFAALESGGGAQAFHRVVAVVHEICDALVGAESAGIARDELRAVVAAVRGIHASSAFIRRLQEWPRGHSGDFETIEQLWRGENRAPAGTLAYAFETYALSAAIAQQHRNKVAFQADAIRHAMAGGRSCRLLSIGCGSCPDVLSVIDQVTPGSRFVLSDGDAAALARSRDLLAPIAAQCDFVQGMVPRVLRRVRASGPYDLIIAGGLFDYLSDRLIEWTLDEAWHSLLAPGGRIVFTNIARGNPFRVWLEYIADWTLIERSESDVVALCAAAGIPPAPRLVRDATGLSIIADVRDNRDRR